MSDSDEVDEGIGGLRELRLKLKAKEAAVKLTEKTVHDLFLEIDTDGSEELDANELDTVGLFVKNWLLKGTPAHELGPMVGISASAVGITAKARLNYKSFERWYFEAGLQRRLRDLQERNKELQTTRDMAVRSLQKLEPHPKGTVAHCEACIEKLQREVEEIDERVEEVAQTQYKTSLELVKSNTREQELRSGRPVHPEVAGLREETAEWNRKGDEIEAKVMAMNAELEQLRKDNMRNALKYAIGGGGDSSDGD